MTAFKHFLSNIQAEIKEVEPLEAQNMTLSGAYLIDVREQDEIATGIVPHALLIGRGFLEMKIENAIPEKSASIVLYCAGGTRSLLAAKAIAQLGYSNVCSMKGGISAWKAKGFPVHTPERLSSEARQRYFRHISIPEIGEEGQLKLKKSRVLIVGAGGLGSPSAIYLAAAGVGTLGLVDDDKVDLSNLQRQILHSTSRVGSFKVDSAKTCLSEINPEVKVETHRLRLNSENVDQIISNYDVILDGCDNFTTRYLVNDACVNHKKINVHGSVFRFQGQVSIFNAQGGPCYRCLFPEPPPAGLAPSCAEAGVLGVLPGLVGLLQATEAIKSILEIGESLAGRLLMYDAIDMSFRHVKVRKNPKCPKCSGHSMLKKYVHYEETCETKARQ